MIVKCWLTITSSGSTKCTKGKPDVRWDEIAVALNLDIPDALFKKPAISASIKIPDSAVNNEIPTEVLENLSGIIQAAGFKVTVKVDNDETG